MLKRILSISTWILSAAALVALLGFARYTHFNTPIQGLELIIQAQADGGFIDHAEMNQNIRTLTGIEEAKPLKSIHIKTIRSKLQDNPYIEKTEAFTTIEGHLKVKLFERKPILRIYTQSNQSFYIDHEGIIFPTHPYYIAHVLVANGHVEPITLGIKHTVNIHGKEFLQSPLKDIDVLANAIYQDEFLKVLIDQIYFNSLGQFELTPKIGMATILIGDSQNLDQKLENISIFFKSKATSQELLNYSIINAMYTNQIVCTKRDTL
ncbi:MAG: hypothetical protein CVT92_00760 [Bacteroidetes bacterium HGW-Bacteroidetes-1]|jgi:cell division protein FtsQ|nr:MAG: hypothetical protein CVT92_00760 [Bacteroidetes bacterium HGW-Bacteroidetes-1]